MLDGCGPDEFHVKKAPGVDFLFSCLWRQFLDSYWVNSAQKVLSARPSNSYFPAGNHWANDKFLVVGDSWDEKQKKSTTEEWMDVHKTFKEIIYVAKFDRRTKLCIHALSDSFSSACGEGNLRMARKWKFGYY